MGFNGKGICVLCLVLILSSVFVVATAAPSLSLSFYKDNGYGMGNDMNGLWTINTDVSAHVVYVEFYLDDQLQQNATASPFKWQFDTANYTEGQHTIRAVAYDAAGQTAVAESQRNFVGFPLTFVVVIIAVIAVALVIPLVWAVHKVRKKETKKRNA